jgi:tetratricopeptide (TPR) repeat protein
MYRRAFLLNPLVDLRIAGAVTPPRDPVWETLYPDLYEFYFQAFDDMLHGDYDKAYGRFVKLHRERRLAGPGQGKLPMSIYWFEGLAAAHIGRWDEADQTFERLVKESEDFEKKHQDDLIRVPLRTNEYRYFLASIRHAAGSTEQALQLYRQTLENDLGLYMAHVQMANIFEADRRYPEAIEERKRAVDANPDDPSLLTDLGVTIGKSGNGPPRPIRGMPASSSGLDFARPNKGSVRKPGPRLPGFSRWRRHAGKSRSAWRSSGWPPCNEPPCPPVDCIRCRGAASGLRPEGRIGPGLLL